MHHPPRSRANFLTINKVLFFVSVAFLVICVKVAVERHGLSSDGDATALSASQATTGESTGDDAPTDTDTDTDTDDDDEGESSSTPRSGWPKVDRDRLRFGVVHDVADAFALGKYSGLVSLSTESERRLFGDWCERAAAWTDPWNRDPILYADGRDRNGALAYRVELHGDEIGRIHMTRYGNGWNIVGVERKITNADLLADERILREAAARAGVVRKKAGFKASGSSKTSNRKRKKHD